MLRAFGVQVLVCGWFWGFSWWPCDSAVLRVLVQLPCLGFGVGFSQDYSAGNALQLKTLDSEPTRPIIKLFSLASFVVAVH